MKGNFVAESVCSSIGISFSFWRRVMQVLSFFSSKFGPKTQGAKYT